MSYINVSDFIDLYIKICQRGFGYIYSKLNVQEKSRTISTFNDTGLEVAHWWILPALRHRWNKLITGSAEINYRQYFINKYISPWQRRIKILSVGCGSGSVEKELAQFKEVESVLAIDIAYSQIESARQSVRTTSIESRLQLNVMDYARETIEGEFDVVLFNSSLHHFNDIPAILDKVKSNLVPGGLLLLNEYVGPDRFQWTDEQLMLINDLLASIPGRYRRIFRTRLIKSKVWKPGILRMIVNDPSEAPHSSIILEHVHKRFSILEEKGLGGNLLMPLLKDISHNFLDNSPQTHSLLASLIEKEDEYIRTVRSNFVFGVYARNDY